MHYHHVFFGPHVPVGFLILAAVFVLLARVRS